jgi:eukaryotic-like serine/threonine-protein kinase
MTATVTLRLFKGELDRTEYVFDERTTCILGRANDCVPRLPSDEYHGTVSRHHCLLDINPPDVRVRDLGSLNGTFVNGEKIGQRDARQTPEEGAAVSFPERDLTDGDEIRLGETVFRVAVRLPAGYQTLSLPRCEPAAAARRLVALAHSGHHELMPVAGYTLLRELGRGGMGAVYLARSAGS